MTSGVDVETIDEAIFQRNQNRFGLILRTLNNVDFTHRRSLDRFIIRIERRINNILERIPANADDSYWDIPSNYRMSQKKRVLKSLLKKIKKLRNTLSVEGIVQNISDNSEISE